MKTSRQVLEWQAEARAEGLERGRTESVVRVLEARFGALTPDLTTAILAAPGRLIALLESAVTATDLADFRQSNGL